MQYKFYIILVIISLGIMFYFGYSCKECPNTQVSQIDTTYAITPGVIYHDTVLATVYLRPKDRIIEVPTYILIDTSRIDTIYYSVPAFVAKDTIYYGNDTLYHEYWFPENCNDYIIKKAPDTQKTITIYIEKELTLWQEVKPYTYSLGGILLGFGLGSLK